MPHIINQYNMGVHLVAIVTVEVVAVSLHDLIAI